MVHPDWKDYFHFTGPSRRDKSLHTLQGILEGLSADRAANEQEVGLVKAWLVDVQKWEERHPFDEIVPQLDAAVSDGVFQPEELEDLRWVCRRLVGDGYWDRITSDMQQLHGVLGGISADGVLNMEELDALSKWIEDHQHLRRCWPYDEIESLLVSVRADKFIDHKEHAVLQAYFAEFTCRGDHRSLGLPMNEATEPITAVCAVCPEIEFSDRVFCFTGSFKHAKRTALAEMVTRRGGRFVDRVTKDLHYLVIGGAGNPCWAYACYGRKVEQALNYRKAGDKMLLVHEFDFWDAVQDTGDR